MIRKFTITKIVGLFLIILFTNILSTILVYKEIFFWEIDYASTFLVICLLGTLILSILIFRIKKFTFIETFSNITIITFLVYGVILFIIVFSRSYYSRSYLFYNATIFLILQFILFLMLDNPKQRNYYIANFGIGKELCALKNTNWKILPDNFKFDNCDGVIIDLHEKIDERWVRFISNLSLTKIPIYYAASIYEDIFSKVSLGHLNEGLLTSYVGNSSFYLYLKRLLDLLVCVIVMPIVLFILLITVIIMKIESRDKVLFLQQRVGTNGTVFTMYKLRTMKTITKKDYENFTEKNDKRITSVGRFLRKYRIDELPQFLNIIKGDMSLIGPRPEQPNLSKTFEKKIPFYNYRNTVKPGITGWAQVNYGYASTNEETMEKLSYDLYYVKNLSIRLDLKIIIKTVRTVLTGFGHR